MYPRYSKNSAMGVDRSFQGRGIGNHLLATALVDCYQASQTFAFIALILDCIDEHAKRFYQRFDFAELPGYPMRLYLPFKSLESLARGKSRNRDKT
jgi:ribosomal protein S18 acetylase RimI-like enzyme